MQVQKISNQQYQQSFKAKSLGNSSRIIKIIKHKGNEYKCTKVAAPKQFSILF